MSLLIENDNENGSGNDNEGYLLIITRIIYK